MSYIIIHTKNKEIAQSLNRLYEKHKSLFVSLNLNPQGDKSVRDAGTTRVMRNNGVAWSYVSGLLEKHSFHDPMVFFSEWIDKSHMPKIFQEAGKYLKEKPTRKLSDVPKHLGLSKEELKKIKFENVRTKLKEGK